jgi:hypothetical protein
MKIFKWLFSPTSPVEDALQFKSNCTVFIPVNDTLHKQCLINHASLTFSTIAEATYILTITNKDPLICDSPHYIDITIAPSILMSRYTYYDEDTLIIGCSLSTDDGVYWLESSDGKMDGFIHNITLLLHSLNSTEKPTMFELSKYYKNVDYYEMLSNAKANYYITDTKELSIPLKVRSDNKINNITGTVQSQRMEKIYAFEGNKIAVFDTHDDDKENPICCPIVTEYPYPSKIKEAVITTDENAILLNQNEKTLYKMDFDKQQIVSQYYTQTIEHIAKEDDSTIVAINDSVINKYDTRLKNPLVATKKYSSKKHFTALSTNLYGGLALGDADGFIRLYKSVGQKAKCVYPGFGGMLILRPN